MTQGRFKRLAELDRPRIQFSIDGRDCEALEGDTLLVALLTNAHHLRVSEFDGFSRSGFCLMGACQDCGVWTADGDRLRACDTPVAAGMAIRTDQPEATWAILA